MTDTNQIIIFDTTLRDGEQSPGASMNQMEKLRIATQLEKLGVNVIEAGFPAASEGDFEAVKAIAKALKTTRSPRFAGPIKMISCGDGRPYRMPSTRGFIHLSPHPNCT